MQGIDWRRSRLVFKVSSPGPFRHESAHGPPFSDRPLRRGGWSALSLALFAVLMSLSEAPTLRDRFEAARMLLPLPRGASYQGFAKALCRYGVGLIAGLRRHLVGLVRAGAGARWTIQGWCVLAVDGSKFDAPRTPANQALGLAGKHNCGPQMLATILVHLGLNILWDWRIGNVRASERSHLRSMLGSAPKGCLLVGDAGFMGFDCLRAALASGRHVLVRLAGNTRLIRAPGDHLAALWPKQAQRRAQPLVLRLIRFHDSKGRLVVLGTDVRSCSRLSDEQAKAFYRLRWGAEVCYRSLKQTLERRKMRSAQPTRARLELHWTMLGLLTLGLLTLWNLNPRLDASRWSVAAAVRAVRHAARSRTNRDARRHLHALRTAITPDTRRDRKQARNWPHKKNCKLPGPPPIRPATPQERHTIRCLALLEQ